MKVSGSGSANRLLVEIMGKRLRSLGLEIDRRLVSEMSRRVCNGVRVHEKVGNLLLVSGGEGKEDLVANVGGEWKVSLVYHGMEEGGEVGVFAREDRGDGRGEVWVAQNLPDGSAARILVDAQSSTEGKVEAAYVCRSSHMFGGLLWDWSMSQPAEVAYYPDGNIHWRHRYQDGHAKARAGLPVFENWWKNGELSIVEFGNDLLGKSRPVEEGPSYSEFYPDGHPAVEICAERRWSESQGRSILQPNWKALYYDEEGKRTTREVLMETKSNGGFLSPERRREIEDQGESRKEEEKFLHRFTESIRLRDTVDPCPFFLATALALSTRTESAIPAVPNPSPGLPRGRAPSKSSSSSGSLHI